MVTDLQGSVDTLLKVSHQLSPSDQKFALDLVQYFKKHHKLSPKQLPWVDKLIAKATAPAPTLIEVGGFAGVVALFNKAKEHLKYPKIVLSCLGKPIYLSVAGKMATTPGVINVAGEGQYPNRAWYGKVTPAGEWMPSKSITPEMKEALQTLLTEFGVNPARVAKKYGKLTGNCCFCNSGLTDKRSTAAGFGPVCADHYGLKDQWKMAVVKAGLAEDDHPIAVKGLGLEINGEADEFDVGLKQPEPEEVGLGVCFICEVKKVGLAEVDGQQICESCREELGL